MTAPTPLRTRLVLPARLLEAQVVLGHAGLRQGEADEHADGVERDQLGDLGAGDDHEDRGACRPGR